MNIRALTVLALAALLSTWTGPATSHSELPSEDWCADGDVVEVGTFHFRPATLVALREQCEAPRSPGSLRACGHFDDDYDVGFRAAAAHCEQYAMRNAASTDIGSSISLVSSPATFLHQDHHELYELSHGLSGSCVRCEQRAVPEPVPVLPSR